MSQRSKTVVFDSWSDYRVVIVIAKDLDAAIAKRMGEDEVPDDLDAYRAISYHESNVAKSTIFLRPKPSVADIVHESWHVIFRMMDYLGARIEDEVVAYQLDYLCQQVFDFARKR
jgi:hypothetical protein